MKSVRINEEKGKIWEAARMEKEWDGGGSIGGIGDGKERTRKVRRIEKVHLEARWGIGREKRRNKDKGRSI